jgi:biotin operon repressor
VCWPPPADEETEQRIIALLKQQPKEQTVLTEELSKQTQVSQHQIKACLKTLKQRGQVGLVIENNQWFYELKE